MRWNWAKVIIDEINFLESTVKKNFLESVNFLKSCER